jgi:hypothetical protein
MINATVADVINLGYADDIDERRVPEERRD